MSNEATKTQIELEGTVAAALKKLGLADQNNSEIIKAKDAALDAQTLLTRPIKIAVGGEFSSGKSTFVEMLLGQHVVQAQASASAMPTVHFQYSETPGYRGLGPGGSKALDTIETLGEADMRELDCLEVMADIPFLRTFEIFDTPGTSDPSRTVDQLLTVSSQVDFIIWCTNATQAWRESERRMWEYLPFELKQRSILLVTHVDLPSVKASLGKLMKRLMKETANIFGAVIPVELLAAQKARDFAGNILDKAVWKASGGAECLATMHAMSAEIRAEVFHIIQHDLETKILPVANKSKPVPKPFITYWASELRKSRSNHSSGDHSSVTQDYLKLLNDSIAFIANNQTSADVAPEILVSRLKEARNYIENTLAQEKPRVSVKTHHNIIEQLDWEFRHTDMLS